MKKKIIFTIIILLVIGIFSFLLYKNNKKDNKITLGEVTHSIFYTPLYVAIENGYFKEENIDLELMLISGADKVSSAVLSGDVEIGFAGAESALYVYEKNKSGDYLKIFAGLTKRDGQFIVGRNNETNFTLENLYGKEILVGRKTGMPALNFLNALKNNNIDEKKININYSIDFASLSGSFIGNTGDYVNLFEPNALKMEQNNYGYVVSSIGMLSGEMPYTVFYAKNSFIKNNENIIKGFRNAINKGIKYTLENSDEDIAKIIYKQFPDMSLNDLTNVIRRYRDNDSWLTSTKIDKKLLINLEDLLLDYKLIDDYVDYNKLIIN